MQGFDKGGVFGQKSASAHNRNTFGPEVHISILIILILNLSHKAAKTGNEDENV